MAVGCRVLLTYNIEVSDGLLNDAIYVVSYIAFLADTIKEINSLENVTTELQQT